MAAWISIVLACDWRSLILFSAFMMPISARDCQQAVFEVAVELARQDKRLAELASALPLPDDFDPDTLPSTVEIELYSRIQAVKADYLRPGLAALLEGAQLSDADLRRTFQDAKTSVATLNNTAALKSAEQNVETP